MEFSVLVLTYYIMAKLVINTRGMATTSDILGAGFTFKSDSNYMPPIRTMVVDGEVVMQKSAAGIEFQSGRELGHQQNHSNV